jgi:hypothetical protein
MTAGRDEDESERVEASTRGAAPGRANEHQPALIASTAKLRL